jgi:hypothetical protein
LYIIRGLEYAID